MRRALGYLATGVFIEVAGVALAWIFAAVTAIAIAVEPWSITRVGLYIGAVVNALLALVSLAAWGFDEGEAE